MSSLVMRLETEAHVRRVHCLSQGGDDFVQLEMHGIDKSSTIIFYHHCKSEPESGSCFVTPDLYDPINQLTRDPPDPCMTHV